MATMYDVNGKILSQWNLQDKQLWCSHGESKEQSFVNLYGNQLGLDINPKKSSDPYAIDLVDNTGKLADLKTQNTPFFFSDILYNKNPQYSVTFNKNDAERYASNYTNIDIYFWVNWEAVRYFNKSNNPRFHDTDIMVAPMHGVWQIAFEDLLTLLDASNLHEYKERRNDTLGNSKDSFVVELSNQLFRRVI